MKLCYITRRSVLAPCWLCVPLVYKGVGTSVVGLAACSLRRTWIAPHWNKVTSDILTTLRIFFHLPKSCVNLLSLEWLQDTCPAWTCSQAPQGCWATQNLTSPHPAPPNRLVWQFLLDTKKQCDMSINREVCPHPKPQGAQLALKVTSPRARAQHELWSSLSGSVQAVGSPSAVTST